MSCLPYHRSIMWHAMPSTGRCGGGLVPGSAQWYTEGVEENVGAELRRAPARDKGPLFVKGQYQQAIWSRQHILGNLILPKPASRKLEVESCGIHAFHEVLGIDVDEIRFFWTLH